MHAVPDPMETLGSGYAMLRSDSDAAYQGRQRLRAFLRDLPPDSELASWLGQPFAASDAELVVSELVTNAAEHGEPPVGLRLSSESAGLRIEVADGSSDVPSMHPLDPRRASGRGLHLVAALSRAWGTDPGVDGKVVWALMGRSRSGADRE